MSGGTASKPVPWMLVANARAEHERTPLPKRSVLLAVARRGLPRILEASVAPAILFFVVVTTIGAGAAMVAALAWGYGAILRRMLRKEAIPGLLVLATVGLTVKTLVGLLSGSTFVYFLQPVATTVAIALVFLGSVLIGRPMIARVAHDFCPIAPEVAGRPTIARLFAGLTVLWASVQLITAATTFGLLVSLPVPLFVALKQVASSGISAAAVVITVVWALRIARDEGLVFAPA